jgi:hypothetical protein
MFEVALICSDCGEDTQEVVKHIDDVDRAVCPCGYTVPTARPAFSPAANGNGFATAIYIAGVAPL